MFLTDVRADGGEIVRSDNSEEFCGEFSVVFRQFCIKQECAKSLELNGVAKGCLGIIEKATLAVANPQHKSPYAMWHGTVKPVTPHHFLRPGYCRWNRPSKSFPRAEIDFYVVPGTNPPRDSRHMLTRANHVVETRDVTWEAPPWQEVAPLATPTSETPEVSSDEESTERESNFTSLSRSPFLGKGIPHQRRTAPT